MFFSSDSIESKKTRTVIFHHSAWACSTRPRAMLLEILNKNWQLLNLRFNLTCNRWPVNAVTWLWASHDYRLSQQDSRVGIATGVRHLCRNSIIMYDDKINLYQVLPPQLTRGKTLTLVDWRRSTRWGFKLHSGITSLTGHETNLLSCWTQHHSPQTSVCHPGDLVAGEGRKSMTPASGFRDLCSRPRDLQVQSIRVTYTDTFVCYIFSRFRLRVKTANLHSTVTFDLVPGVEGSRQRLTVWDGVLRRSVQCLAGN